MTFGILRTSYLLPVILVSAPQSGDATLRVPPGGIRENEPGGQGTIVGMDQAALLEAEPDDATAFGGDYFTVAQNELGTVIRLSFPGKLGSQTTMRNSRAAIATVFEMHGYKVRNSDGSINNKLFKEATRQFKKDHNIGRSSALTRKLFATINRELREGVKDAKLNPSIWSDPQNAVKIENLKGTAAMQELGGELVIRSQPLTENLFNIALHQGLAHLINKDQGIDVKPAWIKAKDAPDPVRKVLDNVETLVGYVDGFRVSWDNKKGLIVEGKVNWKNGVLESKRADILKKYNELTGKSLSEAEFDLQLIAEIKGQTIDQIKIKGGVIGYAAIAVLMVVAESDGKTIDLTKVQLAADKLRGERYGVVVPKITATPMPIATGESPIATGETEAGTGEVKLPPPPPVPVAADWPTVVPAQLRVENAKQFIPDIKAWETEKAGADPQDVVATAFTVYSGDLNKAVSVLIGALFDADPKVRLAAIEVLMSAKDKLGANKEKVMQAINVLASNDPDATVKAKAGDALTKILAYTPPVPIVEAAPKLEYAPAPAPRGADVVVTYENPGKLIEATTYADNYIKYLSDLSNVVKAIEILQDIKKGDAQKLKEFSQIYPTAPARTVAQAQQSIKSAFAVVLQRDFLFVAGASITVKKTKVDGNFTFSANGVLKGKTAQVSRANLSLDEIKALIAYRQKLISEGKLSTNMTKLKPEERQEYWVLMYKWITDPASRK